MLILTVTMMMMIAVTTSLLLQAPLALDALGSYVLVAFAPLELNLLHVTFTGALSPTGKPIARIKVVRELSIMTVGQPITVSCLSALAHCSC